MKKRSRRFCGNIPEREGASLRASFDVEGVEWRMYEIPQPEMSSWTDYKVIATKSITGKANYWIGANRTTGAITRSKQAGQMATGRPALYAAVEACLSALDLA